MPPGTRNETATAVQQQRTRQVRAAQVRLLYRNANTGGAVTIITAPVLSYFQWDVIEHPVVAGWSGRAHPGGIRSQVRADAPLSARFSSRHRRQSMGRRVRRRRRVAGVGWGAAGILLLSGSPADEPGLLVFVWAA